MPKARKSRKATPNRSVMRVAKIVMVILLVPLFGNIFVDGWNWGLFDFVVMGALLFGTGMAVDYVARKVTNPIYQIAAVAAIFVALLAIWVELAVDGVSQALALL